MDNLSSRIRVEAGAAGVSLRGAGRSPTTIAQASCGFEVAGKGRAKTPVIVARFPEVWDIDGGIELRALVPQQTGGAIRVRWRFRERGGGVAVTLVLSNDTANPIRLSRLIPFSCDASTGGSLEVGQIANWSFFRMGWQSWSATRAYRMFEAPLRPRLAFLREMEENPANPASFEPGEYVSEQMAIVADVTSHACVTMGFLGASAGFGDIRLHIESGGPRFAQLVASHHRDGVECAPGEAVESEPLWIAISQTPDLAARQWALESGSLLEARVPASSPVGWCSWYHYFTKIDEAEMERNLRLVRDARKWIPFTLMQLDDGWQREVGDWLDVNEKFPAGIAPLMKQIDDAALTPGLWIAPFVARPGSKLFKQHRDWFIKDARGRPRSAGWNPMWGGRVYALDPTHPDVQDWLARVFRTIRREWGARFIKIDFCYAAALPGVRHDPRSTRASALRTGLETIREAVGDDTFILGCGCPLQTAVGLVDAMRIGCDVTPAWANRRLRRAARDENLLSSEHALRNVLTRSFLHGAWWANDPDCLMIRRERSALTDNEVRAMASVYAVSGGMLLISDDMSLLEPDRIELASAAADLRTPGCRVPEIMSSAFPETAVAELPFGYLLLVANWSDDPVHKRVNLAAFVPSFALAAARTATEVWTRQTVSIRDGEVDLGVFSPHEARLIFVDLPMAI